MRAHSLLLQPALFVDKHWVLFHDCLYHVSTQEQEEEFSEVCNIMSDIVFLLVCPHVHY